MNGFLRIALASIGAVAVLTTASAQETDYAAEANAAFLKHEGSARSSQTASEMALCRTLWERWQFVVDSSNVPSFNAGLHRELLSKNAKRKEEFWLRKSQEQFRRYEEDESKFGPMMAEAQERADDYYAAWVNVEPGHANDLPEALGTCR
ncbi:MAG: hypothetical protein WAT93_02615 [Pontixanthobacter sp.]